MTRESQQSESIGQLLSAQPLRRAPENLEVRVMARLSAAPWWRESFRHWPLTARIGFLIASYGFIRLALAGVLSIVSILRVNDAGSLASPAVSWLHTVSNVLAAVSALCEVVFSAIPTNWLYGAAVFGLALYASLFGLGALAYRSLYVNR